MNMWINTIEPSLGIIQFEALETRGEHKVAYSEIIYVGFKLPKWPRRPVWLETLNTSTDDIMQINTYTVLIFSVGFYLLNRQFQKKI